MTTRFDPCPGSYTAGIRVHPITGAKECAMCGCRFDRNDCAGESKVNVPLHSYTPRDLLMLEQMGAA